MYQCIGSHIAYFMGLTDITSHTIKACLINKYPLSQLSNVLGYDAISVFEISDSGYITGGQVVGAPTYEYSSNDTVTIYWPNISWTMSAEVLVTALAFYDDTAADKNIIALWGQDNGWTLPALEVSTFTNINIEFTKI